MRKLFIVAFLIIGIGFVISLSFKQKTTPTNIKNVILLSIDSLGTNHLSEYGYTLQTTPNIDRFLNESYVYKRAVSPSSWTLPVHMSIFTSMYPSEHKLVNKFSSFDEANNKVIVANLKQLTPSAVTLAEILNQNEFATGAFTGDAGVGEQYGFAQGFDTYFDDIEYGGFDSSAPKALEWLTKNKDKKFFLFLHGYDVNERYILPPGTVYKYADETIGGGLQNKTVQQMYTMYDEKISQADLQFKKIIEGLEKLELMDNTLIVVFGDHGFEYYEHERLGAGNSLYGELVNVPLAIHLPGQTEGKQLNSLVSLIDIMPTILNLLGIHNPVEKQTRGIDLSPSLTGADISRNVFLETDFKLTSHKRSVQTPDGWKFVLTLNGSKKELYNLNSDPEERINLVDKEPQKTIELEQLVLKHLENMNAADGPWVLGCPPKFADHCL